MPCLLIKDGFVVCPHSGIEEKLDILIKDGIVVELKKEIPSKGLDNVKVIDARAKIVSPGLIDINTHMREPGKADVGTIKSVSKSAAAGGFTSIACMPDTHPVIDSELGVEYILSKAREVSRINIFPIGALTKGLLGEELSDMYSLVRSGVVAMADFTLMNTLLMRYALEYRNMFDIPIISFCEDKYLSKGACINEGLVSTLLGFKGVPSVAEEIMVQRDIMLTEFTQSKLHISTISSMNSVSYIREAKHKGINISAEVTPYHFSLVDDDIIASNYDTNLKISPPLRTAKDKEAIIEGLRDNTIDAIVSVHSPSLLNEKDNEFINAAVGVVGLETMVPLIFTNLIDKKALSIKDAISKITINPAMILNLPKGSIKVGGSADITVIDPLLELTINDAFFHSISKNSPFIGKKLKGFAVCTIVNGEVVYKRRLD